MQHLRARAACRVQADNYSQRLVVAVVGGGGLGHRRRDADRRECEMMDLEWVREQRASKQRVIKQLQTEVAALGLLEQQMMTAPESEDPEADGPVKNHADCNRCSDGCQYRPSGYPVSSETDLLMQFFADGGEEVRI